MHDIFLCRFLDNKHGYHEHDSLSYAKSLTVAKIRQEFKEIIIDPYLKMNPDKELNLYEAINFENMFELKFYTNCF